MKSHCIYSVPTSFTQYYVDRMFFYIGVCCNLFILLVVHYYNACIYHDIFIQFIVDEHLGCFHLGMLYKSCSENVCVNFQVKVRISLEYKSRMEFQDHKKYTPSNMLKNVKLFSKLVLSTDHCKG